ncbi:hypothetical protein [Mycobacterium lepromatosis]|uniref:hypothetical protein n=1 Tax=Mycobacterium lepromatosis TaxID=480418 RepID=UPI0015845CB3|nr:hypothetical protein [Mycobacterium lepromatosis]
MTSGEAGQYAVTKAANALPVHMGEQEALNVINVPTQTLLCRPLTGNEAMATCVPGKTADMADCCSATVAS